MSLVQDTIPTTTNPAQRVVYRGDRTIEQQNAVQLTCYNWSSEQPKWDPEEAYAVLEREHGDALPQYEQTRGSAVRGAAGPSRKPIPDPPSFPDPAPGQFGRRDSRDDQGRRE